ncbi:MAG: hypothetical protein IJ889_06820 [Eubacterium sp.]|nr:hypothetical protein [Eubacterium sp.]MBR2214117.1 hypothetical protein [Eubacterium sp.]MBR2247402.1 hypothetical protein [Bacilli bacterium]
MSTETMRVFCWLILTGCGILIAKELLRSFLYGIADAAESKVNKIKKAESDSNSISIPTKCLPNGMVRNSKDRAVTVVCKTTNENQRVIFNLCADVDFMHLDGNMVRVYDEFGHAILAFNKEAVKGHEQIFKRKDNDEASE